MWKKYSLLLLFLVPWQPGNISRVLCSCSEVFSGAGRKDASRHLRLLFWLQIWSSSCLKRKQCIKLRLFTVAVIILIAALIAYGKWVGVFMVSRGTPWRSLWQLHWFLRFTWSGVCSSDLKMHFGWVKSWRKYVTFYNVGLGGWVEQRTEPEGGGLHIQLCYTSLGWPWASNFVFFQCSVVSLANGIKIQTCFSALRFTH